MMTKERFELELLKIKDQFPADHVGAPLTLMNERGQTCIYGQLLLNTGSVLGECAFPVTLPGGGMTQGRLVQTFGELTPYDVPSEVWGMILSAVRMNNAGMPWHQIVDRLVPPTAIEPSEISFTEVEPVAERSEELVAV